MENIIDHGLTKPDGSAKFLKMLKLSTVVRVVRVGEEKLEAKWDATSQRRI